VKLVADEIFDNAVLRGVLLRLPGADFVRVQDVGLSGAGDEQVLAWAGAERRIIVTHDVATTGPLAVDRVRQGLPMPGVFQVARRVPIARAIDDLTLVLECSREAEWDGQVRFLPL
jgi:hypothetical protein